MYPPAQHVDPRSAVERSGRFSALVEEARRQSLSEVEPGEESRMFYRLPIHQRIIVMMAGPFMNLFLAVVLFSIMLVGIGLPQPTAQLETVVDCVPSVSNPTGARPATGGCAVGTESAAALAGLQAGDTFEVVAGQPIDSWDDLTTTLGSESGPTEVTISRGGQQITKTVELTTVDYPVFDDKGQATGATTQRTFLGVRPAVEYVGLPLMEVPAYMWDITATSVGALFTMPQRLYELGVTLTTDAQRSPESPVSVVGVSRLGGEIAAADRPLEVKVGSFLGLAASLNLFLFLFNLLPILPLDGGHVAAALWEGIRRKFAGWRGRPDPGPVDTARLLPLTYSVAVVLITVGVMVIWADIVKPITLGG